MQTKTFLEQWGGLVTRKLIREDNLFVFDETRVGKGQYQQEVVTCHGDSVDHKEATLKEVFGTFIPFSRAHGDTLSGRMCSKTLLDGQTFKRK